MAKIAKKESNSRPKVYNQWNQLLMMEMMSLRVAIDKMILVRYKTFSQRIAPIIRERFVLVTFKNLIDSNYHENEGCSVYYISTII